MKRRFIAGAVCPQCQLQDKIVLYVDNGDKFFECVKCGYKEKEQAAASKPVATPKPAAAEQIIKFVPMPKK